jgi:hypothetical protein
MNEQKDRRQFCCICDAIVELSPDHQVIDEGTHRMMVVDNRRAHILLKGSVLAATLKRLDSRVPMSKVLLAYKDTGLPPVEEAPAEQPADESGAWLAEIMGEEISNA